MIDKFEFNNVGKDFPIGIFDQNTYFPMSHHHIEYELFYLESGNVTFGIGTEQFNLHAGDAVFIQPDVDHYVKKEIDNKYHYYALVFDTEVLGNQNDMTRKVFESMRIYRFLKLSPEIVQKIAQASQLRNSEAFGSEFIVKSALYDVISHIISTNQFMEIGRGVNLINSNKEVSCIDGVLNYISQHYRENIALEDVLKVTCYSKSHFIRLFKKYVGINLTDYVNQYRVEKACLDLIYTKKNVTQIAMENGFNTVQYFSKMFKDYMNCTPKQYQKNGKNLTVPSAIAKGI